MEYETNLKAEQAHWERQLQQLKEEHEQTLVEMMSREKIRDIADQQVMFNEALNKAMDEKNKQMQNLIEAKTKLEDELSKMAEKKPGDMDLVQQLAELGQKNTQLEAELKESKSRLEQVMTSSVMTLHRPEQDPHLQR